MIDGNLQVTKGSGAKRRAISVDVPLEASLSKPVPLSCFNEAVVLCSVFRKGGGRSGGGVGGSKTWVVGRFSGVGGRLKDSALVRFRKGSDAQAAIQDGL